MRQKERGRHSLDFRSIGEGGDIKAAAWSRDEVDRAIRVEIDEEHGGSERNQPAMESRLLSECMPFAAYASLRARQPRGVTNFIFKGGGQDTQEGDHP